MKLIFFTSIFLLCFQCGLAQNKNNHKWNFNDLTGWQYGHQDDNPRLSYYSWGFNNLP